MGEAEDIYRRRARLDQAAKIEQERAERARRKTFEKSEKQNRKRAVLKIKAAIPSALERLRLQGFPGGELRQRSHRFWSSSLVSWEVVCKSYDRISQDIDTGKKFYYKETLRVYLFSDGSIRYAWNGHNTLMADWRNLSIVVLDIIPAGIQRLGV